MSQPGTRRAHMVSRGYLRAWADESSTVEVIDQQRNFGFPTSINNATVFRDAYKANIVERDLEAEFAKIEEVGIPALVKLSSERPELRPDDMTAIVSFLDMHLDRGRYADQAATQTPATVLRADGSITDVTFSLGDRLLLSKSFADVVRLRALGLEKWDWRVELTPPGLATGDGAVLMFGETAGTEVVTIAFPLSPTKLLVIGKPFEQPININALIAEKSRRWLVGRRGTLRMGDLG